MPRIQNIHIPSSAKNLAINGALDFWQEKAGTTTTVNTATPGTVWMADMVRASHAGTSVKNFSVVRSTDVPTAAQSGFDATYSTLWTQLTGLASPSTTDILNPFLYSMEGYDYAQIHGKKATFGFWIKGSIAGTYGFSLRNENSDRTYRTTFTINQPNTWEFKSITVQMDTQGTWNFDNGRGVLVAIGSTGGASVSAAPSTSWNADGLNVVSGVTNWTGTTNATLRVAMFSITEGIVGFGAKGFQRAGVDIQQEFALCQRYYEKTFAVDTAPANGPNASNFIDVNNLHTFSCSNGTNLGVGGLYPYKVPKRATPTATAYGNSNGHWIANNTFSSVAFSPASTPGTNSIYFTQQVSTAVVGVQGHLVLDARL